MIRESVRTSKTLARISRGAECLFYRLLTLADDFGRFEADPEVLRSHCFSRLLMSVSEADVATWLQEMVAADVLRTYAVHDKVFAYFVTWDRHQRRRSKHSKYPDPPADVGIGEHATSTADACQQPTTDVARESRVESRESREKKRVGRVVLTDDQFLDGLRTNPAYRGLDLEIELAKMDAWLLTPQARGRQKTRRFIVNWMNRADRPVDQDRSSPRYLNLT